MLLCLDEWDLEEEWDLEPFSFPILCPLSFDPFEPLLEPGVGLFVREEEKVGKEAEGRGPEKEGWWRDGGSPTGSPKPSSAGGLGWEEGWGKEG